MLTKKQENLKQILLEKLKQNENKEIQIKLRYAKNEFGYSANTLKNVLTILKKEKIIKVEKIGSKGGIKLSLHLKEKINIKMKNINFENKYFIGREKDINFIKSEIKKGHHILIYGKTGVGKTNIMNEIFKNEIMIYTDYINSVKDIYKIISEKIIDNNFLNDKEKEETKLMIKKFNIKQFQYFLIEKLKNIETVIVIDNINNNINKNFLGIIQILQKYCQIILIIRENILNNLTNTEILWPFKKIEIKRLDSKIIKELVEKLIIENDLIIINKSIFLKKLENNSKGNLIALFDILRQLKKDGIIDFEKINNISHVSTEKYFDLSYLILIFIIFAVVLKISGRSNQNNDYILVGSVLLYIFMFIRIFLVKMVK